jgi:hypothetical protein
MICQNPDRIRTRWCGLESWHGLDETFRIMDKPGVLDNLVRGPVMRRGGIPIDRDRRPTR